MLPVVVTSDRVLDQATLGVTMSALLYVLAMFMARQEGRAAMRIAAAVTFCYGAFFLQPLYQCALVASSCILTISALRRTERDGLGSRSKTEHSTLDVVELLVIAILPVLGLLVYRLGSFSSTVLTWEGTTINGLLGQLQHAPSSWWQVIQRFLLWSDGTLSAGENSLLFGLPALFLSREFGPSITLLRSISVFWMVGAIITFALIFRRGFGVVAPCIAALIFGLNEVILIYGRYGSSLSATMFSLVVAVILALRLLERRELGCAFLFSLALYAATLGYAAARISVLILVVVVLLTIPLLSGSYRRTGALFMVVFATVGVVVLFQQTHNRQEFLLRARTEQILYLTSQKHLPFKSEVLTARGDSEAPLSWREHIAVAQELVQKSTATQLWKILNPFDPERRSRYPFQEDPPFIKLFAPALFPWMLLGFWAVWRPGRRHLACICVSLVGLGVVPLLLTNRVDSYRSLFLTIPFSIWITFGIVDFMQVVGRNRASRGLIYLWLTVGLMCGIMPRRDDLYAQAGGVPDELIDVTNVVSRVTGPMSLILNLDHAVESMVKIELFKRTVSTGVKSDVSTDKISNDLTNEEIFLHPAAFEEIADLVKGGTQVILAPAHDYKIAAGKLRQLGYVIRTSGAPRFSVLTASTSDAESRLGIAPDKLLPPLAALEPLTQPQPFRNHLSVDLTSSVPIHSHYDFAEPQIDRTFSGAPAGWRNVRFSHWLGTHATTTIEYAVPDGAEGFQSWIGISPGVGSCTKGSAQVTIRDQDDKLIYTSPLLRVDRDPVFLSIALSGITRIRIHVSDAGDNRDCDHVDFGDPSFMIPKR